MDVLMPQLGETVAEGKITKWFKSAGDAIKPGDNLFEIETDKVSMEVPSTTAGVLAEIRVGRWRGRAGRRRSRRDRGRGGRCSARFGRQDRACHARRQSSKRRCNSAWLACASFAATRSHLLQLRRRQRRRRSSSIRFSRCARRRAITVPPGSPAECVVDTVGAAARRARRHRSRRDQRRPGPHGRIVARAMSRPRWLTARAPRQR